MQLSMKSRKFLDLMKTRNFRDSPIGELSPRDAVLELSERAAGLAPSSFNAERYTVDVIFSSGAAVERSDLQGALPRSAGDDQRGCGSQRIIGGRRCSMPTTGPPAARSTAR